MPEESLYEKEIVGDEVEGFPVVPEAIYDAVITDIEPYVASSGRECAWWRFKLVGESEYAGQVVSANTNLPVAGMSKGELRKCWKFKSLCEATGISPRGKMREIIEAAKGKRVKVEVLTDQYGGAERSYVNSIVTKAETEIPF